MANKIKIERTDSNQGLRTSPVCRRSSRKGSGLIELAFVILPLFALIFAILDFSLAIFVKSTLYHAAREGVRFAVTQQTGAGGQDAAIKNVVRANSMGFIPTTAAANTYVMLDYTKRDGTPVTGVGSNSAGNILTLTITAYPYTFFAPIWHVPSLSFTAASADAMESPPLGILPAR